ncbi:hypothetical protein TTHERM_01609730, partial (macronuclear) [Tetrahymena thermophila SB210]
IKLITKDNKQKKQYKSKMRARQVKQRAQNLSKVSRCILKQKKSTNVFKMKKCFKKIPFIQLQEEVISGNISRHLQTYLPSSRGTNQTEKSQIRKQLRRLIQKQISPHIMDDIVESYQELLAHKYLQNGRRIQKRVLLISLKDKIWQSYQEKLTSGQPSSLFLQELVEKSKISNQEKAKNEQNTQKQIQVSKCQASYLYDKEKKFKAERISLPNFYSFQNALKEYLREKIECKQQYIQILELVDQKSLKQQQDDQNNCKLYSIIKEILNVQRHQQKGKYLNNQTNKGNYQTKVTLTQIQRQNLLNLIIKNQINKFNRKLIHIAENQLSFPQLKLKIEKPICTDNKTQQQPNNCKYQVGSQQLKLQKLNLQDPSKLKSNREFRKLRNIFKVKEDKLIGGGICGSKQRVGTSNIIQVQKQKQNLQQIIHEKDKLEQDFQVQNSEEQQQIEDDEITFKEFNKQYKKYINDDQISEKIIEGHVRKIIEKSLYEYREYIIQVDIRHKVIDMINLLINYFLIIRQSKSTQSIQSDINLINSKLETLIIYCK